MWTGLSFCVELEERCEHDVPGGFGWLMRNVREGTVRFAPGSAGETKKWSESVMKPPAMGETVT